MSKYRLINRTLYQVTPHGQLKAISKVPSYATTVKRALEYLESGEDLDAAIHQLRSEVQ